MLRSLISTTNGCVGEVPHLTGRRYSVEIIDNVNELLGDDLKAEITPGLEAAHRRVDVLDLRVRGAAQGAGAGRASWSSSSRRRRS